jgi:L-lactate dehydrogenase complex protein LldG
VNARDTILARLRAALADGPTAAPVPRDYGISVGGDIRALFVDRLVDYKATVHASIGDALAPVSRLLVPPGVPAQWLSAFDRDLVVDDGALSADALEAVDAVLTGCAVAIAETGTIVLDGGAAQGRRAVTLMPDRHIVIVREDQIVGRVPEAVRRLAAAGAGTRPLTWISGPSATSDIELVRIEGVHGPRHLDVVIVTA